MAYSQVVAVKRALITAWSALLPNIPETDEPVGCDYAHPGDATRLEHIWLHNVHHDIEPRTIKAGRKLRTYLTSIDVHIQVRRLGPELDETFATTLQAEVDERAYELFGILDEWVADNPRLGFNPGDTTLVIDHATFTVSDETTGSFDHGCGARILARLTYQARIS